MTDIWQSLREMEFDPFVPEEERIGPAQTPAMRAAISASMKGKNTGPRSEETKRKISEALKGKKYKKRSEEGCRKISERMKGNDFGKYRKCCKKKEL